MAKNSPAAALGRGGGRVTSDVKATAVRENGKLGGRPRLPPYAKCGAKIRQAEEHIC